MMRKNTAFSQTPFHCFKVGGTSTVRQFYFQDANSLSLRLWPQHEDGSANLMRGFFNLMRKEDC